MAKIELNNTQLRTIQSALDMYLRIGIGQFTVIKDHPTFQKHLSNLFQDKNGKTDYNVYHKFRDMADNTLTEGRNILIRELNKGTNASWGINHQSVDESCREAHDIIQVIRHEFWKQNENRSNITVDSSVHLISAGTENIKVEL